MVTARGRTARDIRSERRCCCRYQRRSYVGKIDLCAPSISGALVGQFRGRACFRVRPGTDFVTGDYHQLIEVGIRTCAYMIDATGPYSLTCATPSMRSIAALVRTSLN